MKQPKSHPAAGNRVATRGGSYSLAVTALVLAILAAVNALCGLLPKSLTRQDISAAQLYSVTSATKASVGAVTKDVTVYWIVQAGQEDSVLENLLAKYESLSDRLTVEKKNPDVYPTYAAQYTDGTVENNSLVVVSGERSRYIGYTELYPAEVDYSTYSYSYSFDGEGLITSAIAYVVSDDLPQLYVLEGHGEAELPEGFQTQLTKENIECTALSLLKEDVVPEEADAVLIYSPASDLSSRERDILAAYLASGGKLLVFAGPVKDGTLPNLLSLLADYGVEAEEGMVIEEDSQYYVGYPYLLLPEIQSSGITDPLLSEGYYVTVPAAQGLRVTGGADVTELLTTSDTAYSKAAGYAITTYEREDGDSSGPFALAVRIGTDGGGEMVWVASGYFLEDAYNDYSSGANLNFTMNALSELMGESDTLAIRSKSLSYTYLTISESSAARLKTLLIGVLPGAFLLYGIFTVVERRRKRDA